MTFFNKRVSLIQTSHHVSHCTIDYLLCYFIWHFHICSKNASAMPITQYKNCIRKISNKTCDKTYKNELILITCIKCRR